MKRTILSKITISIIILALFIAKSSAAATCSSISQHGITWTFSTGVQCGQFVTGDWWVAAPVTITSKKPEWTGADHGSMMDPVPGGYGQGYHDNVTYSTPYADNLRVSFPLTISTGVKSLVSTITDPNFVDSDKSFVENAAVLTIVDTAPAATAFRPPFVAGTKTILNSAKVNYALIPSYPAPATALDLTGYGNMPTLNYGGKTGGDQNWMPKNDWGGTGYPAYGFGKIATRMLLMTILDTPNRISYINKLIQIGIDDYAKATANDFAWMSNGGYGVTHFAVIIFAGKMLGNSDMVNVGRYSTTYPSLYKFSELGYTYYNGAGKVMFGSDACSGGTLAYPPQSCSNVMCRPIDGLSFPENAWGVCGGGYRLLVSTNYPGQALAMRMLEPTLGTMTAFNHPAFFDYTDYWVNHPEDVISPDLMSEFKLDSRVYGGTGNGFMKYMWSKYRKQAIPKTPLINSIK